ncbi:hypothetical protein MTO96_034274, partial [Rhipicephalus appendiculatus]
GSSPNSVAQDGPSSFQKDGVCEVPGKPDAGLPHEGLEGRCEKADTSSGSDTASSGAVKTSPEPEPMTGIESDSTSATGKRPHDAEDKKEPDAAATDEPPAKTTPLRRAGREAPPTVKSPAVTSVGAADKSKSPTEQWPPLTKTADVKVSDNNDLGTTPNDTDGDKPADMDTSEASTSSLSAKRTHEDADEATTNPDGEGQPPSKTVPIRRSTYRP